MGTRALKFSIVHNVNAERGDVEFLFKKDILKGPLFSSICISIIQGCSRKKRAAVEKSRWK